MDLIGQKSNAVADEESEISEFSARFVHARILSTSIVTVPGSLIASTDIDLMADPSADPLSNVKHFQKLAVRLSFIVNEFTEVAPKVSEQSDIFKAPDAIEVFENTHRDTFVYALKSVELIVLYAICPVVKADATASDSELEPSFRVVLEVIVTFASFPVHVESHVSIFAVTALASVTVSLLFVNVAFTPKLTGSSLFMIRMISPAA
jgi:hypothetical protein